ncbi:MAG: TetR/AcrR family transcriptional regulator [Clostridia bacterium]|nr:TetR/AcrR family transcriptional regulator [Clostridia bacterium]
MASVAQKKLDKKLRLLKSAYALFESRGVNMTAVEDVVKAAGVAKGTFYLYFKDKHDLVDQMMIAQSRSVLHEILGELQQKRETEALSPADRLIFVFDRIFAHLLQHQKLVPLICTNLSACCRANCESEDEATREDMKQLLDPFLEAGLNEIDAKIHLFLLSDMLGGLCCEALLGEAPYELERIRPCVVSIITKSVTPGKEG